MPSHTCPHCADDDETFDTASELREHVATEHQCAECRDGEHTDYDDEIRLVSVSAPGETVRRIKACGDHRDMLAGDGYTVRQCD